VSRLRLEGWPSINVELVCVEEEELQEREKREGEESTTTWFERKLDFFEHFKRPKFFILGKFCIHPPGGQAPRAHLIWARERITASRCTFASDFVPGM
jgi:hypothetical protein